MAMAARGPIPTPGNTNPLSVTSKNVHIDAGSFFDLPLAITVPGTIVAWSFKVKALVVLWSSCYWPPAES
jgi:hypothetical protein